MDVQRASLIDLSPRQAFSELKAFWKGARAERADQFAASTGEDYEQCLVEYVTAKMHCLNIEETNVILERSRKDAQFYELAHLVIESWFPSAETSIEEEQRKVLSGLCEWDLIWTHDLHFKELLAMKGLPETREGVLRLIRGNV